MSSIPISCRTESICPTCKHSMVMQIRAARPERVETGPLIAPSRSIAGQMVRYQMSYQFACHRYSNCVWQNPNVEVTSCTEWEPATAEKNLRHPAKPDVDRSA